VCLNMVRVLISATCIFLVCLTTDFSKVSTHIEISRLAQKDVANKLVAQLGTIVENCHYLIKKAAIKTVAYAQHIPELLPSFTPWLISVFFFTLWLVEEKNDSKPIVSVLEVVHPSEGIGIQWVLASLFVGFALGVGTHVAIQNRARQHHSRRKSFSRSTSQEISATIECGRLVAWHFDCKELHEDHEDPEESETEVQDMLHTRDKARLHH